MCEVTRRNFEEKYPQIIDDLQSASYIFLDCEFSGLFDEDIRCSLFDTPKERHKKLQSTFENFCIIQLGLSAFEYERESNTFNASTYTFYLLPSTCLRPLSKIIFQLESADFLVNHKFDFNKLFYDGISYLNKSEESEVLKMIDQGNFFENVREVQKYWSQISEWLEKSSEGNEMSLELTDESDVFTYMLHIEIRSKYLNIWTYHDKRGVIKLKKVSETRKRDLMSNKKEEIELKNKLLKSLLGFSRIMKELERLNKPIIGHNFLLDLMMIYKQFYDPSRVSYKTFKQNINRIFPKLYDTKHISFELRNLLPKGHTWASNSLSDLYHFFGQGKGSMLVIFTPIINHKNPEFVKTEHFHSAGFDSYCTGFCFVKMAHMYSLWNPEKQTFNITSMHTTSSWLLKAVEGMKNRLNVSRGQVNFVVLDGPDPKSTRPGLLYIKSRNNQPLDISQISEVIAKFASVDIQPLNRHSGLMAVANKRQLKEILESFKNHKAFQVTNYSFLKHSTIGISILGGSFLISIVLLAVWTSKGSKSITFFKL